MKRYVFFFLFAVVALLAMDTFLFQSAMAQGTGINSVQNAPLLLNAGGYTGSPPYMTILPEGAAGAGNIGIGTAMPLNRLDVNGGMAVGTYAGVNVAPANGMIVSGNVGIGITPPTAWLTVYNGTATGGAPATSGSTDANMITRAMLGSISVDTGVMANGNAWIQSRLLNNFASDFPLLLNPNGGNVGIGITAPQATLDVSGGIRAGSASTGGGCSPEGAMGYDFGDHQPVYCNGSAWTSFSAAAHIWEGDFILASADAGGGLNACTQVNPFTGGCSCPPGSTGSSGMSGMNFHSAPWDTILTHYTCYK